MTTDKDKTMWRRTSLVVAFGLVSGVAAAQARPVPPVPPTPPAAPSPLVAPIVRPDLQLKLDTLRLDALAPALDSVTMSLKGLEGLESLKALDGMKGLGELKGLGDLRGLGALEGLKGLDALSALDAGSAFEGLGGQQGDTARAERLRERATQARLDADYERGTSALDRGRYDQAVEAFDRVVAAGGARADGALYWKAYALNRLGKRTESLATIDDLLKKFPASRWTNDAKALQIDVKQATGQPVSPDQTADEELKLMALNAVMQSDPERALPLLEKVLQGADSPRVKERALFVLAQSGSPQAREIIVRTAKGGGNPDLQMLAIRDLGVFGGAESRQALGDIYAQATDLQVKKEILRSFMVSGERERLLTAAKGEKTPELRAEAIQLLGALGAQKELAELYDAETNGEVRKRLLHAMFVGGNADKLAEVARGEKDPELRRAAIRSLGLIGQKRTGDTLVALYDSEKAPEVRREVVQSLFIQNNAGALVALARKEKDPELKKEIVSKLSLMKSKEATDYMLELLK